MLKRLGFFVIFSAILISVMTVGFSSAQAKKNYNKKSNSNPKYASIVMDADSGMILSQRYADNVLHPASLTKMMTLLMAFEALDRGDIRKTDRIRITNHAAGMPPSKLGLRAGSNIKVEDAMYALVTKSANDVAAAMGEHLGGSETKFAAMMTARARSIGMTKTTFKNASGLPDKAQVSSARDMAKLARYILQRYPHYYRYFSTKNFTYQGKTYRNHNRLMDSYRGMDGFKTGYIGASGFNLVASANRDGRRLIGVVFGGRSSKSRNDHMAEILDYGFKKAGQVRIARVANPPKPQQKPNIALANTLPTTQNTSDVQYASLTALSEKNKASNTNIQPNYTALTAALQNGAFGEMIGEGDFDPAVSKRLETGLIAIAVHKGDYNPNPDPASAVEKSLRDAGHAMVNKIGSNATQDIDTNAAPILPHPKDTIGKWAVQIGAFNSRMATDEALAKAKAKLPASLSNANTITVPLKTAQGMIFRARLGNMTQEEAMSACKIFRDCMPIAPMSTRLSAQ